MEDAPQNQLPQPHHQFEMFSTCSQSAVADRKTYLENVIEIAQWSESAGCTGILIYSDNRQVDPWALAQIVIEHTTSLAPLVAVQPIYMHPYAVAKKAATFGYLFGRRIFLNMIAGGFKNDLTALHDTAPHDERYLRLAEYTAVIQRLLGQSGLMHYDGRYYKLDNIKLMPPLDRHLQPGVFVSGSSAAGLEAAKALSATAIHYPEPASQYSERSFEPSIRHGIRIGIIARDTTEEAWEVATEYFPEDRKGQLLQQMAMKVSDSVWHKQLSKLREEGPRSPYWLFPFENYKTFCPYLVGSYDQVSTELEGYLRAGIRTVILDIPKREEDFVHINKALQQAAQKAACQTYCRIG
ncbi:MAG: LLM class flavin-dependent oxidoreductase [Acidobacteria bacterium]|nr:LLM class flavin-dependent oxidoreductase [Acidobacteriota bacterium]